jgi:hypothetical protein
MSFMEGTSFIHQTDLSPQRRRPELTIRTAKACDTVPLECDSWLR